MFRNSSDKRESAKFNEIEQQHPLVPVIVRFNNNNQPLHLIIILKYYSSIFLFFFYLFKPELLQEVFKNLDLESLKSCREVCTNWNTLIFKENYFLSKICLVHRAVKSTNNANHIFKCHQNNNNLNVTHLRIQQLYCSKYETNPSLDKLFIWLNSQNLKNFKHLEFKECQMILKHFFLILNQFTNINQLTINDDTLIYNPSSSDPNNDINFSNTINTNSSTTPIWILKHGEKLLTKITKLHLILKGLNDLLFTLNESNLLNTFQNLTELHLKGCLGSDGSLSSGSLVTQLIKQNQLSLRSLKIDAFPSQYSELLNNYLKSYDTSFRNELCIEFQSFCQLLLNSTELFELQLPNLEELSLDRFPLANMNDEFVDEVFLPFLMKLKNLRKFSIGQLYFSNDLQYSKLTSIFPTTCEVKFTSVHLYVPINNLEDLNQLLHPNQLILPYEQVSAELGFENVQWNICYLTWNSLKRNSLMQSHLSKLVKLRLFNVLFNFGDEEMQFIINEGQMLMDLQFDLCNLQDLSDSGLTGLSNIACARIRIDKSYQVNDKQDFVGVPLSKLTSK